MADVFQHLVTNWSIEFYAGWSFMDLFRLGVVLLALSIVLNYFLDKAGN